MPTASLTRACPSDTAASALYRPRESRTTALHRLLTGHFRQYQCSAAGEKTPHRRHIDRSIEKYLDCGDPREGFARIRCGRCGSSKLVAFSCKQRCTCPSCHRKRTLMTGMHVAENVCAPVGHRQVVLTIPKRLRIYPRRDWSLVSPMAAAAAAAVTEAFARYTGQGDFKPGIVLSIQTFGTLLNWHPHIHAVVTTGVFAPGGRFREIFRLPEGLLLRIWKERIFQLFLDRGVISEALVAQMRAWPRSGFSVDDAVYIRPGDTRGLNRLVRYIVRAPVSLERIVKLSGDGTVIYRSEKNASPALPRRRR